MGERRIEMGEGSSGMGEVGTGVERGEIWGGTRGDLGWSEGRFGVGEDSSTGNRERGEPRWEKRAGIWDRELRGGRGGNREWGSESPGWK